MAKAYSDDLRRKLLEAHQQGEGSFRQLAARFRVSVSWAKNISATRRRTGQMERPPAGRRGPRSKLTPEVQKQMREWIAVQSVVKGGVKLDQCGGEKVDHFTCTEGFGLKDLRGRLERRPATRLAGRV